VHLYTQHSDQEHSTDAAEEIRPGRGQSIVARDRGKTSLPRDDDEDTSILPLRDRATSASAGNSNHANMDGTLPAINVDPTNGGGDRGGTRGDNVGATQ